MATSSKDDPELQVVLGGEVTAVLVCLCFPARSFDPRALTQAPYRSLPLPPGELRMLAL